MEGEPPKTTSGMMTLDPAKELPIGAMLHFAPTAFPFLTEERSTFVRNWEVFEGCLLAISFSDADGHAIEGSAVLIAPGVAMCATHVLRPHMDRILASETAISCIGLMSDGVKFWQVRKVTQVENTDLSLLGLEFASPLPSPPVFPQAICTTRMPRQGERLMLFGFRASEKKFPRVEDGGKLGMQLLVCSGLVTASYAQRRDSVMLPWPSFEVDCPCWGGMSGGPILTESGELIGLNCSSFSDEGSGGPAYGSLLWPAFGTTFEGGWPSGFLQDSRALVELDPRVCKIVGRESLLFGRRPDGSTQIGYRPWTDPN